VQPRNNFALKRLGLGFGSKVQANTIESKGEGEGKTWQKSCAVRN